MWFFLLDQSNYLIFQKQIFLVLFFTNLIFQKQIFLLLFFTNLIFQKKVWFIFPINSKNFKGFLFLCYFFFIYNYFFANFTKNSEIVVKLIFLFFRQNFQEFDESWIIEYFVVQFTNGFWRVHFCKILTNAQIFKPHSLRIYSRKFSKINICQKYAFCDRQILASEIYQIYRVNCLIGLINSENNL